MVTIIAAIGIAAICLVAGYVAAAFTLPKFNAKAQSEVNALKQAAVKEIERL